MSNSRNAITGLFSPQRGLIQRFCWVAGSGFMRQLAFFIVNGYLAYQLSKKTFGTLTIAFGCLMVFVGVADFGLRQVGWREVARRPANIAAVVGAVFSARLISTAIALIGFLSAAAWYCRSNQEWVIFLVYSLGLLFNSTSFDFPFLGQDRMDTLGRAYALAYAYYVPACLITVRGDGTAWLVPVHFVVAHAILFAALYVRFRRDFGPLKLSFRPHALRSLYEKSWALGVNFVVFRLTTNYPVLLLGLLLSSAAVAEYRVAEMFYALFASLGLYLGSSTFTVYASYVEKRDGRIAGSIETALRTILLVHVPIGFLFITLLPTFLDAWLHGGSYDAASICLLLGISLPLGVANRYLKTCLPSVGLNKELLVVNSGCLIIGTGVGLAMIRVVGGPGIAVAILFSEVFGFGLLLLLLRGKLPTLGLRVIFAAPATAASVLACSHLVAVTWHVSQWISVPFVVLVSAAVFGWLWRAQRHQPAFS